MEKRFESDASERLLDETSPRWNKESNKRFTASSLSNGLLVLIVVLLSYLATVTTVNMATNISRKPLERPQVYSPANVALEYELIDAWDPTIESQWLHGTFDETENAWVDLLQKVNIGIDREELLKTQENFADTKTAMLTVDGANVATLGVYHAFHCLYVLRVALHRERYNLLPVHENALKTSHLDHCLDALRSDAMCHGDTTLYWAEWVTDKNARTDRRIRSSSQRQCVNWDKISSWTAERALPPGKYKVQEAVYAYDDTE